MISPKPTTRQQKPSDRDNRNCRRKCIFARLWIYQRKIPTRNNDEQHPIPIVTCANGLAKTAPNCLTKFQSHRKPSRTKVILKKNGTESPTTGQGEEIGTNWGKLQSWQIQKCLLWKKSLEKTSNSGREIRRYVFWNRSPHRILGINEIP